MPRTTTTRATYQSTLLLHFALLLLALFYSLNVAAAESAGRLLFARGEVEITSVDAEPRTAQRGDVLQVGDTIRTGTVSNAQLRMSDGAMISLKADTIYRIEAQDYNAKAPGEGSQVGELVRGGLRAITGAIGHEKPEAVKYRTPVATIGIRGTVFDTIVIPPEGLPELPGMAPGTYVMVLEGQVLLSTASGELLLGPGEVGYVPFVDAPPELRPDLSAIFVEFAAYHEELSPTRAGGQDGYSRTVINQRDRAAIYTLMADVGASQFVQAINAGPYAMVTTGTSGTGAALADVHQGNFMSSPVTLGGSGDLINATGGTGGDIAGYQLNLVAQPPTPYNMGSFTAGDSTINWGSYAVSAVILTDAGSNPIAYTLDVNYIDADNVIVSTADLPTTGSYTYDYKGGSGQQLLAGSNLTVDFGTATMDVTLISDIYTTPTTYTASNQSISAFYGSGITLTGNGSSASSINGRFVGSGAEGAISTFILDAGDGFMSGTAAFAR